MPYLYLLLYSLVLEGLAIYYFYILFGHKGRTLFYITYTYCFYTSLSSNSYVYKLAILVVRPQGLYIFNIISYSVGPEEPNICDTFIHFLCLAIRAEHLYYKLLFYWAWMAIIFTILYYLSCLAIRGCDLLLLYFLYCVPLWFIIFCVNN